MNKTKIGTFDSTWNHVTGCYNTCEYCYARNIAKRFGGFTEMEDTNLDYQKICESGIAEIDKPLRYVTVGGREVKAIYPFFFTPTLHRYRLDEPQQWKKGRNIFVCSMADLFEEWIPDSWIEETFKACEKAPQHNYLFLTKNPSRMPKSSNLYNGVFSRHSDNYWFGTTITYQKDLENRLWQLLQIQGHSFLSIEPILDNLDLNCIWVSEKNSEVMLSLRKKRAYYFGGGQSYHMPEWVIIGAETGRRKDKVIPKREWIENIVEDCKEAEIPVFMKTSLADIWREPLIQEFPDGLKG